MTTLWPESPVKAKWPQSFFWGLRWFQERPISANASDKSDSLA
jgi:hypothetical protein